MKNSSANFRTTHRRFRRGLLAGVLLLPLMLADRGFALDPAKSLFQFNCQNWTRQNGLPANKINSATQTRDGYIWLGTQNGLVRFDGEEFKLIPITLPQAGGQDVRALERSSDGGVWFAIQSGGFGHFDGQSFSTIVDDRWANAVINANTIMEARDGSLWMGGDLGLDHWVKGKPGESLFGKQTMGSVLSFCEDPAGKIWLGTSEHGLYYWTDGKFVSCPDEVLNHCYISAVAVDAENRIWVGTQLGLYYYLRGRVERVPGLNYSANALLVDRHGVLWVGTSGMGLARYENGQFTYLGKADGLGSDNVTALHEDAEGNLWVGTRDGLSELSDLKFPIYSSHEGIGVGSCRSVVAGKSGGVWIATDNGVSYFDGHTGTNYPAGALLPNGYIKLVFQDSNGVVYAIDGDKNINVFTGGQRLARYANTTWPEALAEDSQGVLAGIGDTLFRIQDGKLQPYLYKDGLQPAYSWIVNLCVAKDGAIWVASNNGIFRVQDGTFKQWSTANGLSGNGVLWICEDVDGSIWAGLTTGIACVRDGEIKNITQQDGLPDNRVYAMIADDCGSFWCDSGRGIFRVNGRSLNDFADGKTNRVECELFDSMKSVKYTDRTDQENSGCKSSDGRIWFPSPLGVMMIDPSHILTNPVAPPTQIERVLANGKEYDPHKDIVVPPGKDELEIDFAGLSYIAPQKIRYRYQLAGYDSDWVEAGNRHQAFYTNLKPGAYTFEVIAANADGVWNKTGDSVSLELQPYFYQTAWFRLLCGVLALAALGGGYAWRVRHLMHKQRALQNARDLLKTEVASRTADLATANESLQREEAQLKQRTKSLEKEIEERNRMQLEVERIHHELLEISRQAGMAEIATNVLHNVGNVLNSVNVSASLVNDSVKKSKAANLAKVAAMLREHEHDLGTFITRDAKGRQLPAYLGQLSEQLLADQKGTVHELDLLVKNIEHIKDVVSMQQSYARVSGVQEVINIRDLVEDSLRMNEGSLNRHQVEIIREFEDVPLINVEKHKVLQVLTNLIRNAKYACDESGREDKQMTVRVFNGDGRVKVSVSDNGIGIPPENLTRIFNHGFTTRKDGHGFGLHSGALAAKEMGGSLAVRSDGPGQGATFTLELPEITPTSDTTLKRRPRREPAQPTQENSHE